MTLKDAANEEALNLQSDEEAILFHSFGKGPNTLEARVVLKVTAPDGSVWQHDSVRLFRMKRVKE